MDGTGSMLRTMALLISARKNCYQLQAMKRLTK